MEITALIISDELSDLNRMIGWFPKGVRVKGLNGFSAVAAALESEHPKLIAMRVRDYRDFFRTYESVRTFEPTADIPLVAVTDTAAGDALKENVILTNTTLIGSSATDGYMKKIVSDLMGKHDRPE